MNKQTLKTAFVFLALSTAFAACDKKDDKELPVPAEQELITTMKLSVTDGGSFTQTFTYKVENGFGSTGQGSVQIDTIVLEPNKSYTVTTELFNEKENPAEDITEEVLEERDEHLLIYQSDPASGPGSISFSDGSKDHNGLPFNQTITFTTGAAGAGTLQVNLIHAPTDKNGATPDASGGETDAEAVYPVRIQ
jgi:hypothetical protein